MDYINTFSHMAAHEIYGLPDFIVDRFDTAFEPYPCFEQQNWSYCRLIVEGLTPTNEQKKYPLSVVWETISGIKHGRFYYTADGNIGKGWISNKNPDDPEVSYSIDFINGKLSHIWVHSSDGKHAIFNKNKK